MTNYKTGDKALIGLTGGIASGKSTVSETLHQLNVGIVDADKIAREVVSPGSEGLAEIIRTFGSEYRTAAGELDRKKLAALIFKTPSARKTLNAITHPLVAKVSGAQIAALHRSVSPYIVYDVPLLIETQLNHFVDAVVVVATSQATQVARCVTRDNMPEAEAVARISAQLPLEEKVRVADYVIDNNGTLDQLRANTRKLHQTLLHRFSEG